MGRTIFTLCDAKTHERRWNEIKDVKCTSNDSLSCHRFASVWSVLSEPITYRCVFQAFVCSWFSGNTDKMWAAAQYPTPTVYCMPTLPWCVYVCMAIKRRKKQVQNVLRLRPIFTSAKFYLSPVTRPDALGLPLLHAAHQAEVFGAWSRVHVCGCFALRWYYILCMGVSILMNEGRVCLCNQQPPSTLIFWIPTEPS